MLLGKVKLRMEIICCYLIPQHVDLSFVCGALLPLYGTWCLIKTLFNILKASERCGIIREWFYCKVGLNKLFPKVKVFLIKVEGSDRIPSCIENKSIMICQFIFYSTLLVPPKCLNFFYLDGRCFLILIHLSITCACLDSVVIAP